MHDVMYYNRFVLFDPGTNWLFEVLGMILLKKAERIKDVKMRTSLEAVQPETMADIPSPRILNTHIHYRYLPQSMKDKKVKTVLILRNPKDTAVSFYNHMCAINLYAYSGKWENWLPAYVNGECKTYKRNGNCSQCAYQGNELCKPAYV